MQNVDGYAMLLFRFRPCLLSPVYVLYDSPKPPIFRIISRMLCLCDCIDILYIDMKLAVTK
jgi:hypothetical protein